MTEQRVSSDRMEFEPPPYGGLFIFLMVLLAFATFGLQVGLTVFIARSSWSFDRATFPIASGAFVVQSGTTVLPGNSVVWNGELWVSAMPGISQAGVRTSIRAPSSHLMAIDLQTGQSRDTGLVLSPSPLGLLVVDEQLWAVSETVVYSIQNKQAIPRHPRRALFQPTKPFMYEGRLAVIDKSRNDVYSLLTWNEGEWIDVGQIEAPASANASTWFTPELRVLTDEHSTHLFFSDIQALSYREGIVFISATDPVSAMDPENCKLPANVPPSRVMAPTSLSGWEKMPLTINWGFAFDVAIVNGELRAFTVASPGNTVIQWCKKPGGTWVTIPPKRPVAAMSFSAAGGSPGYLVINNLQLLAADNLRQIQRIAPAMPMAERIGISMFILTLIAPYVLSTGVLCLGTWRLMRTYRTSQYLYGKRTVVQASILRRGIARGVDSTMMVFPAAFWFLVAVDDRLTIQQQYQALGIQDPMVMLLFSIFGMWLGTTLVLSYVEGCWGITPGKWLCGIRTLRTTLRPCGMLRALTRELLVYVDSVFLMTWLPGVLLIAFTNHRQRLGDLTADTVVVLDPK